MVPKKKKGFLWDFVSFHEKVFIPSYLVKCASAPWKRNSCASRVGALHWGNLAVLIRVTSFCQSPNWVDSWNLSARVFDGFIVNEDVLLRENNATKVRKKKVSYNWALEMRTKKKCWCHLSTLVSFSKCLRINNEVDEKRLLEKKLRTGLEEDRRQKCARNVSAWKSSNRLSRESWNSQGRKGNADLFFRKGRFHYCEVCEQIGRNQSQSVSMLMEKVFIWMMRLLTSWWAN